jgi:hypothetical protein
MLQEIYFWKHEIKMYEIRYIILSSYIKKYWEMRYIIGSAIQIFLRRYKQNFHIT